MSCSDSDAGRGPEESLPTGKSSAQMQAPGPGCTPAQYGSHSYWFCDANVNFDDSRNACRSVGMDLAAIDNASENQFVRSGARADSFIGLTDRSSQGAWKWISDGRLTWCGGDDGNSNGGVYGNWANGEPESAECEYRSRNSRGYWFCREGARWSAARSACTAAGMSLARVYDATESAFLRDHLRGDAWLGGSDLAAPGDWRWVEGDALFWSGGQNGASVGGLYVNWANGRPLGGPPQDCLLTNSDGHGRWFSAPCQKQASWVCAGPAQAEPRPPELAQCSMIRHGNGRWTAAACDATGGYVCETAPPDANKRLDELATLIRDDYRAWKPRISHLTMKDGVTVTDPFSAYGARMGLRECVDSLGVSGEPRTIPGSGLEEQQYSQLYKGIPVLTKGYAVVRDPVSKAVQSYTGTFEHDINLTTKPVITEGKAWDNARAAVSGNGKKKGATQGELVIYPATQGPKHAWELAWVFAVPPSAGIDGHTVAVSAFDGRVISVMAWTQEQPVPDCPSVDVNVTPNVGSVDLSVFALPQADFLDPPDARATKLASGPYGVALLSAGTSGTSGGGPSLSKPQIRVQCDTEQFPKIAVLDNTQVDASNDVHIWNLADPSNVRGAGILTAAQRCLEYYAKSFRYQTTPTPIPWLGIDGTGAAPVDIRMWRNANGPEFKPTNFQTPRAGYINFPPEYYAGASLDTVCHEMAHALWFYGAPNSSPAIPTLEYRSLNEGFAEVMASATELDVRGSGHGEWCIGGDRFNPRDSGCTFDLADLHNPARNDFLGCTFRDADGATVATQCPWDYHSPDYCTFPEACSEVVTDGCCEYHGNGTVLSHWYWTLADPDALDHGLNGNSCKYWVDPLHATDSVEAARKATNILFTAMQGGAMPASPDYPAMAHATLTAATDLFGLGSAEAISVFRAWYGVSVIEESYVPGLAAAVEPAREAELVYPWTKFAWPIHTVDIGDDAWDLQIATGPFDPATSFEKDDITSTETRIGPNNTQLEVGVQQLSLPFDTGTDIRYFWRVRPHVPGGGPWNDCFSINSFVGTTHPDDVQNIRVTGEISPDDGLVRPGTVSFQWDGVRGATGYKIQVANHLTDCKDVTDPDVIQTTVHVDFNEFSPPAVEASVSGILPEEDYFINIASIGPEGLGGYPTYGCYHLPFTTTKMRPPTLLEPTDGSYWGYHTDYPQLGTLGWAARDGAEQFRVQLYDVDENRNCGAPAMPAIDADWIWLAIEPNLPPLWNPTGYCWDVTSIAENGSESERSEQWRFHYWHGHPGVISPGEQGAMMDLYRTPAPLPGDIDSYDNDVALRWEKDPLAWGYGIKLGKWPWAAPAASSDPWNCDGTLGGFPSYTCDEEPSPVTFRTEVVGETTPVPASQSSEGRYCWTVWPILANPSAPGEPWSRQPAVNLAPIYCYTSGPMMPVATTVKRPPDVGYTAGEEIQVDFELGYVPDGQIQSWYSTDDANWEANITREWIGSGCVPTGPYFNDIHAPCKLRFTIKPPQNKSYQVWVETFNSPDSYPHAPFDPATIVHQVPSELLYSGVCGDLGEECCTNNRCVGSNTMRCVMPDHKCVHCGAEGEVCCEDPRPQFQCPWWDAQMNPLECAADRCEKACGGLGEQCCTQDHCDEGACVRYSDDNAVCECGASGQPCCPGNTCSGVLTCQGGSCSPQPPPTVQCNQTVHAGGDAPETIAVELGSGAGNTVFSANTFNVADAIRLYYDGIPVFGADTGCIPTNDYACQQIGNWSIDCQGEASITVPYPGGSTQVVVTVDPNCQGTVDTQWYFSLSCP